MAPAHRAVFESVRGLVYDPTRPLSTWLDLIRSHTPLALHDYLAELAVADLPTALDDNTGAPPRRYVEALLSRLHEVALTRSISDLMVQVRQLDTGVQGEPASTRALYQQLQELQRRLANLRETMAGR